MKAAVLHAPGEIRIEERERPEPGPREVLVEITAVGVCGSDVHYYEHGRIGPYVVRAPLMLGHESAGRVVAARRERDQARRRRPRDARAGRARAGAAASAAPAATTSAPTSSSSPRRRSTARSRTSCRSTRTSRSRCPDALSRRGRRADGAALGRHLGVPARRASARATACSSPAPARSACSRCSSRSRSARPRSSLRRQRAPARARRAHRRDARRSRRASDEPAEADALIECSGHPGALTAGIKALRPAGTAVLVGMGPGEDGEVPLSRHPEPRDLAHRHLPLRQHLPDRDRARRRRPRRPRGDHLHRFGLDETDAALRAGREDPASVKPVVLP